ncbi:Neuronal acetylcholine receptor subunit eat-2 [Aphelenchoides fujianensis]|nr:Neuronal acetylcholine receptor subunit eat-2 [Aphelenchoides fujianensis]
MLFPFLPYAILLVFVRASDDEHRLLSDLRKGYDPVERPVANHSDALDVSLRCLLQQILDVKWHDYKLRWSPVEYGNITEVTFPADALWRPDLLLFNSADENFDGRFAVNYVVKHTGEVLQAPPAIVKSSCTIDITWFPFDEQLCFLKYGAWTHTGRKLRLLIDNAGLPDRNQQIDLAYYVVNSEWELVGTPASRIRSEFNGEIYYEVYYYLFIRRNNIYHQINWVVPSILFLVSNILCFSLPSACGEKITLQTMNLLSVSVFLGMVAAITPRTSTSVPFIGAFFALQMVLLGSSLIITILVINISFRRPKTHRMSPRMRSVFLEWLPWLTLMTRPGKRFRRPPLRRRKAMKTAKSGSSGTIPPPPVHSTAASNLIRAASATSLLHLINTLGIARFEPNPLPHSSPQQQQQPAAVAAGSSDLDELLRKTLVQLADFLHSSKRKMADEEEEETEQADWRFMAMAIDRACMFAYAFLSIVIPVCMYLVTPANKTSLYPKEVGGAE